MLYTKFILPISLCLSFVMPLLSYGAAEQSGDSTSFKRELLLFQEIPVVVITAAKVEQPILESPSTITVLTREDIKRYGITSLSDILRNVPGVDVMSVSPTDRNVSMRGFNQLVAGRILSLIDNRPIYLDFYGLTGWEFVPISINEIERIEIVRGPGSALYGANAFDGVVHIITNSAPATNGTSMIARIDQSGKLGGSVIHEDFVDDLTYRVSMGLRSISEWNDGDTDAGEIRRFNGILQYDIDDRSFLHLSAGISDQRGNFLVFPEFDPVVYDGKTYYMDTKYARSNLKCRVIWRRMAGNNTGSQGSFPADRMKTDILDCDVQRSFRLLGNNFITCGLDYRLNWVDLGMLGGQHSQNLLAGYIQDQLRLTKALALTAGLRYDRHPLTENNLSPRCGIVYSPLRGHAFRASAGRAFQNPPFLYSYISTSYDVSIPISPSLVNMRVLGNRDLSPEWVTSLELGYKGNFSARLRGGVDIFYNQLGGLMEFDVAETYDENALFPGSPGGVIPSAVSIFNESDAEAWGGEVSAEFSVTQWLSTYANYSYQRVTDSKTGEKIESSPSHKLNPGLYTRLGQNLTISVFANYVDSTVWDGQEIDSYMLLNSSIRYRAGDTEIALSAFNLLNNRHQEHPDGDEIGRSVVLSLMYKIR